MLKKLGSRKDRVVTFVVTVRTLEPWPTRASGRPGQFAIGWQRGANKRGTTPVRAGERSDDGARATYAFDHTFEVEATVRRAGKTGHKEKTLTLYVLALPEDATRGREVTAAKVGACDVDLAKYVDRTEDETIMIDVECGEGVRRAVGTPKLLISVRAKEGGANAEGREGEANAANASPLKSPTASERGGEYQWASSRFQSEQANSSQADQVEALTSMASMFKKRAAPVEETSVVDDVVDEGSEATANDEADVEANTARAELIVARAATPKSDEFSSTPDGTPALEQEDPELTRARDELFGAPPKDAATSPRGDVDSDGFLLDSDLDTEGEADEETPAEFTRPVEESPARDDSENAAEQARLAEEEARIRAEEDAAVARIEAERKAFEEEERQLEEQARLEAQRAEEERVRVDEEARYARMEAERAQAEEEARRLAEEDALFAENAEYQRRAEEEQRLRAEEEQRLRAEEEQRLRAEEEQRLRAEEEQRLRAEEERRWAMEAEAERARIEEIEKARAHEAEAARRAVEDEDVAAAQIASIAQQERQQLAEEEAIRAAQEEEERQRLEDENLRTSEHEARLQEERELQAEENAKAAARGDIDVYAKAVITEGASSVLFSDSADDVTAFGTPSSHSDDAFYTPATRGTRFADSVLKSSRNRDLEHEIVSMSICDILIHSTAEDSSFTTALGLQERIASVRATLGERESQLEFNRITDAFGVAIKGAMHNPARLVFLCAQLIALRICVATMDDLDTRDVIELEVLARNAAFESLWKHTCSALVNPGEVTETLAHFMKSFCGPSPNGDGEKIGRAWSAMFQLAKTRLDIIGGDADDAGCSSQLLLTQLRQGILKEIILALDKSVLDALIHPSGDALANPMIPGGGALTFSAGAELKRAISVLASVAKDLNVGTSTESIIPKLRAVADVCMIPKDALIDVKLRTDIVCGKLTDEELASVVSRFRPDDFAPQPVDPDVISAVVDAATNGKGDTPPAIGPYTPMSTEGAPWIANLARALAAFDGVLQSRAPGPSAHATRWSLVTDALP
jgi:hypothetical protein